MDNGSWFMGKVLTFFRNILLGVLVTLLMGLNFGSVGLSFSVSELPSLRWGGLSVLAVADASELAQQGRELYQSGQFAAAAMAWERAAQGYKTQGDAVKQAAMLSYLALANQQLGQWTEANEAIAKSLELLQTNGNKSNEVSSSLAQALNTQGSLQLARGQVEEALHTWQLAAATYGEAGDEIGRVGSLINQAQAQQALGFYLRARQTLKGVQAALEKQQDLKIQATAWLSLGNVLRLVGDLDESRRVLEQSLAVAQKLPSPVDLGAILLSLGNTARAQQDNTAALTFYQQAVDQSSAKTTRIQSQLNLLSLFLNTQRWSNAQTLLPQIESELANLPLSRSTVYAKINFAQSLLKMGRGEQLTSPFPPVAKSAAQILANAVSEAKNLGDRRSLSLALGSLGGLYEQTQQLPEAQKLTEQALYLAQAIEASDVAYRWQWQLGRLLKDRGDETGAIAAYGAAIDTLGSLRSDLVAINTEVQFSFRESVEPVYREFVSLLLQGEGTKTSSERLEKARQVIESLQLAELDNFFRSACLNAKQVEIDTIDQKAAVIYPIILPDRLEVILHLPQQPLRHYATTLPQEQVDRLIEQFRIELTRRIGQRFLPLSRQVYDWLIRPAESDIAASGVKTLVFVLDGSLRNIPMTVLHNGEQFLVEKYAIALTPGLELLESRPLAEKQLQVLTGGLSAARESFEALPNVEVELNQIQSLVPSEVLLNQEFTKAGIQNAINSVAFPVVHLATHGQFSSNAKDTFILTWDGSINVNELNDFLQTTDLRRSTPIELLVFSACETAKGDNRAALGIAGVAVRAGARSTIATLWVVDDEATAKLMLKFYQELASGKVTKAEALRRAQQSILASNNYQKHPYYWAPFVLVGNWL
ncbi:MAG TPA: hypothetical protein DDZ80_03215 [Cyanobacteria bacterium UBA8803]|nr:hypothetical protein [Cyanobacteria bacterium UBA9273]HBL57587.1 hypothetical protein [Cyanobacteria bacterium UBA8803]